MHTEKSTKQRAATNRARNIRAAAPKGLQGLGSRIKRALPFKRRTLFGKTKIISARDEHGERMRLLIVDGGCQGATYHKENWNRLPFEYLRAFDRMFHTEKKVKRVLMLGGGGFAYPKHLLTRHPDVYLDVIEPDGEIIAIALRDFHLDRLIDECPDRIRIIESSGQEWVSSTEDEYDAIVNDAFEGFNPVRSMVYGQFIQQAKRRLTPGGLYLANVVTYPQLGDYSHLSCAVEALKENFEFVQVLPSSDETHSDEENYLVIASDTPLGFEDGIEL